MDQSLSPVFTSVKLGDQDLTTSLGSDDRTLIIIPQVPQTPLANTVINIEKIDNGEQVVFDANNIHQVIPGTLCCERVTLLLAIFLIYGGLIVLTTVYIADQPSLRFAITLLASSAALITPFICVVTCYISRQLQRLDIGWLQGFS